MMTRILLIALASLALTLPARAQFDSSSVLGTVRDKSGASVPDAKVTLTSASTAVSQVRTTDQNGAFEFPTVRVGVYVITAEKMGFSMAMADNVQISIGARQRVDLVVEVGSVTESVQVTATASALETDSSQRGQVITGAQTRALPLNGREYSALALLTTGVRASALNTGGTPREGSFNVNGLRSTFNNFLIDGVDNNAYGTSNQGFSNQVMQPPPDAVAEFRVVTNNMSAEYGRSGGATINVAYAAGTNAFRGSAWEFLRDTSMNATGFFRPASGEKPPLERHQYGGVFGGPIVKGKAFFFGDFEGFRQTRKTLSSATIPTLAQREGIFTVPVRNPYTGETFAAGTPVPMTALARKVLGELPAPTNGNTANNYQILQQARNETDKASGKVDVQLGVGLAMFGRLGWRDVDIRDDPSIPLPSGGGGNGQTYVRNKQFATGATWTSSSNSLLEVRFAWSDTTAGKNPPALGSDSAFSLYGITGLPTDERVAGGLPNQIITGFSDLGRQATNPQWQYPTVFNPKVNYTWLLGRHSLKSGYEFQHVQTEVQDVNPLYGRDTYAGQFTRPAGAATSNLYNLADFTLGLRSQYALSNILVANLRQNMHFLYLQDDLRLTSALTLNLGLRYEYATPQWERDNILSNWDPDRRAMVTAGSGSLEDRTLVSPDRNNVAPRLGFAYSLTPRTVLRGGYGISYVHFHRAGGANILPINGPQVINAVENQTNPLDPAFRRTEQGYPEGLTDPQRFDPLRANITYMPRDYHSSQVQSWFVSAQRELGRNMVVDVAYVGNRADDLLLFANFNQAAPNNSAGTIPLQARRPIPEFADITYSFNGGYSRYHAFQAKFDWRLRANLSLLSSLTLSRTTDNGSGSLENQNGNAPAPQDFRNMAADHGLSNYHQPYNTTTSFVWELPIGRGRALMRDASALLDALAGGWQISGINTVYAGAPVTFTYQPGATFIVSGIQQDFRGGNNYRPNVTGDPLAPEGERTIANYFNRNNVVLPTDPGQPFGNAGRNSVRGPYFWQIDFAASKHFAMPWPDGRLEFRFEAFNLLNRTNFGSPNGNRSAAGFGTITSTFDPRQLQLGVKLNF
jgi:Carboxypeptidase regulatory-like domain/TonB-dependent Receptor Plug Domain